MRTRPGHRHLLEGLPNEDSVLVEDQHRYFDAVAAVSDGMGGHARPVEASTTAIGTVREGLQRAARSRVCPDPVRVLTWMAREANRRVQSLAGQESKSPGCTLHVAILLSGRLWILHIGDGTVVRRRGSHLEFLGDQAMARAGNRPTTHLGQEGFEPPEVICLEVEEGDRVLLATDGLVDGLGSVASLRRILNRPGVDPAALAGQLLSEVPTQEFDDDTTFVILDVPQQSVVAHDLRPPAPELGEPWDAPLDARPGFWRQFLRPAALVALALVSFVLGYSVPREFSSKPRQTRDAPTPRVQIHPEGNPASRTLLPQDPVVLVDPITPGAWAVSRPGIAPPASGTRLQGLRLDSNGRLSPAGSFRVTPDGQITGDESRRPLPVRFDGRIGAWIAEEHGWLRITTAKSGAQVAVDGMNRGTTPLRLSLPSGEHRVTVTQGNRKYERKVMVSPGQSVTQDATPR